MKQTNICIFSLPYTLLRYMIVDAGLLPSKRPLLPLSHPLLLTGWAGYVTHLCPAHVATAIIDGNISGGLNITIDPSDRDVHTQPKFLLLRCRIRWRSRGDSGPVTDYFPTKTTESPGRISSAAHGSSPSQP